MGSAMLWGLHMRREKPRKGVATWTNPDGLSRSLETLDFFRCTIRDLSFGVPLLFARNNFRRNKRVGILDLLYQCEFGLLKRQGRPLPAESLHFRKTCQSAAL